MSAPTLHVRSRMEARNAPMAVEPQSLDAPSGGSRRASTAVARRAGNGAVWSLVLPRAERVLCHAASPPAALVELARRGVQVDVVSRCDLETWTRDAPAHPRLRCLWEADRDGDYDLAVLWDPRDVTSVRCWLAALAALAMPPRAVAVWSRNPRDGAPHWLHLDALLRRAGWRLGAAELALPEAERVRQIVSWEDYGRAPLVRHRRSDRPWKAWLARRRSWRWTLPVRLRSAHLPHVEPRPTALATILAEVSRVDAPASLDRLLVSANGVAIAVLRRSATRAGHNAILKVPYTPEAEARVARNAEALAWLAAHAGDLGSWAGLGPQLLAQGRAAAWSWTLEEWVQGVDAQSWPAACAASAMQRLGGFLARLSSMGGPAQPLDEVLLRAACDAPLRAAAALAEPGLARRLHSLRERLVQTLRGVPVSLVPRHGDLKLENVLGDPASPERLRVLDWELWTPRGLPLLDLWHLVASRRARASGCALGTALRRWVLPRDLERDEIDLVEQLGQGLDPRYVALSPVLYWLDRIGPAAARGAWPTPGWERANVTQVLEAVESCGVMK